MNPTEARGLATKASLRLYRFLAGFSLPRRRGIVVEPDGTPVADAIVSMYHAWHAKDMAWSSSIAFTDAQGRFELGFSPRAALCDLRATTVTLTIRGEAGSWKWGPLDAPTGATLDLGHITLEPSKPEGQE
jgi:hypothetical protein